MVFTMFSGRTDSHTHALTHKRTDPDRPGYGMRPVPFINGGGDMISAIMTYTTTIILVSNTIIMQA